MAVNVEQLNEAQTEAVLHGEGHLMAIAGAGSGKTRMLTHRVAHLIQRGHLPSRLFVTTFTNKAAEEMKERLVPMIGERKAERLRIGTFHSLCRKILMDCLGDGSYEFEPPRLLKGGGRFFAMKAQFKRVGLDDKSTKPALVQISYWKNEGRRPKDIPTTGPESKYQEYYVAYETYLKEQGYIDFDDMLYRTYWELRKRRNRDFLKGVRRKIDHILVDEGQDLNNIQFLLVDILSRKKIPVTIVLDDFQILYGFRGAQIKHILAYMENYKPTIVKLEENYRSTRVIVETGNNLIKNNQNQIEKVLFTSNEVGLTPDVLVSATADCEAERVMDKLNELVSFEGYELNDIAIIYRTNAQSRAMVDVLVKNQVPHKVHAPFGFYDRSEIKDIISYVRVCSNPFGAELDDFKRIINRPTRYLGKKFIDLVEDHQIDENYDTYWEAMLGFVNSGSLDNRQQSQSRKFCEMLAGTNNWFFQLKQQGREPSTGQLITEIMNRTGYLDWMNKEDEEIEDADNDRGLNLDSLMVGASRFPTVDEFLLFVDGMQKNDNVDEDDVVHLMTIHKVKGAEYPVVFVLGCSEKMLPHFRAEDPEEERRCAYVAVTRAKEKLFLSSIHGKYNRLNVVPSRFLFEMGVPIPQTKMRHEPDGTMGLEIGPKRVFKSAEEFFGIKTKTEVMLMNDKEFNQQLDDTVGSSNGMEK